MKNGVLWFLGTLVVLAIQCNHGKRIAEMEDELENTTLIAYQLMEENQQLKKELKKSGGSVTTIVQTEVPDEKAHLESSKRKLFVLRMKIMNYQLRNEKFPETVQDLKEVLGDVPVEDRSKSNVIHLERNGKGGWTYDPDEGEMDINTLSSK